MTFWTPQEADALETAVAAKMTASQIGKLLGRSRNAVIGRTQRQGLQLAGSSGGKTTIRKPRPAGLKPRKAPVIVLTKPSRAAIEGRTRAVLACHDDACRYPMGDPISDPEHFGFCMQPVSRGRYCEAHARSCYHGEVSE